MNKMKKTEKVKSPVKYDINNVSKIKKTVKNDGPNGKIEIYEDTKILNIKISKE
jgi:hypothetical protein